jgi:hypothetical protein
LDDGWLYPFLREAQEQEDENQINDFVRATPSDLLACCNRMIGCLAGFDTVFLMSPAMAEEQARGIDDEWLAGFNRTLEILCLAAVSRNIDMEPFKEFAKSAYSFWTASLSAHDTEDAIKRLYSPCINALFNMKRSLMVEIAGHVDHPAGAHVEAEAGADSARNTAVDKLPVPVVELLGKGQPCRVMGKEKRALSDAQYDVVEALLQSGDEGLKKDSLERVRTGARAALKRLVESDSDWKAVICFPARPGLGYRLCRPR